MEHIIIFSEAVEKHTKHVEKITTTFGDERAEFILKKCQLFCDLVGYVVHIIKSGRL